METCLQLFEIVDKILHEFSNLLVIIVYTSIGSGKLLS